MKTLVGISRAAAVGILIGWSIAGFWAFQDQFEVAANLSMLFVMAVIFAWVMKATK